MGKPRAAAAILTLVVTADEDNRCAFGKKPGWQDSLTGVTVEYRDGNAATVAPRLGLKPVTGEAAEDTRVTFRGSEMSGLISQKSGRCQLAAPIGEDRTLLVVIGTDTGSIHYYNREPVDEPCAFLADKFGYPKILEKLRR